jgi:hypothetical protein
MQMLLQSSVRAYWETEVMRNSQYFLHANQSACACIANCLATYDTNAWTLDTVTNVASGSKVGIRFGKVSQ